MVEFPITVGKGFTATADQETREIKKGDSADLKVNVKSDDPDNTYTYQWTNDYDSVGDNSPSYNTGALERRTSYTCYVTDRYRNRQEVKFEVGIANGFKAEASTDTTFHVKKGESVTMGVSAASDDNEFTYQWFRDDPDNPYNNIYDDVYIEDADAASYRAENLRKNWEYYCKVTDSCGNVKSVFFHVNVEDAAAPTVTVVNPKQIYTGSPILPDIEVKDGAKALKEGSDYTVSAKDNVEPGTAELVVKFQGDYSGTVTKKFTIAKRDLKGAEIKLDADTFTANGSAVGPKVSSVIVDGITVPADEYTVSGNSAAQAGSYQLTVTAKDSSRHFTGSASKAWKIEAPAEKDNAITLKKAAFKKTGSASKTVTIGKIAAKALSGKITYKSSTKYVKVDAKGTVKAVKNYTGKSTVTVTAAAGNGYKAAKVKVSILVKPGKMAAVKLKNVKKSKVKVSWKKMTGADKYQVRRASNKKMKKGKKSYNLKASAKSKTIKLKKGKTYYFQVRAYDKQTKSWSKWSTARKIRVK